MIIYFSYLSLLILLITEIECFILQSSQYASFSNLKSSTPKISLHHTLHQTKEESVTEITQCTKKFNLTTALFCGGLAFDAYASPPPARWEKSPQGLNVAFVSPSYTKTLYSGLLEITPIECSDLPSNQESGAGEGLMSGSGLDPYLLVAVAEGRVKDDITFLKQEPYHNGVFDLKTSVAHVGRSATAWSNVNKQKALRNQAQNKSAAYTIPSTWTSGAKGIWEEDPPFYLYIQDPKDAYLVLTLVDENIMSEDIVIGSSYKPLKEFIKTLDEAELQKKAKKEILQKMLQNKESIDESNLEERINKELLNYIVQEWEGEIKLQTKPKKKDKGGQTTMGVVAGAMIAGPAGAAVGGVLANMYEGQVRGRVKFKLRYIPIPKSTYASNKTLKHKVKGGLPGVAWGDLYNKFIKSENFLNHEEELELCAFVNHDKTGCSCAVYRSLEQKLIAISFRGTCEPIDLLTDANIIQTPWVEGVDAKKDADEVPMVHVGFRSSLNSISRRLKELILAAVAPSESLEDYDLLITGHSLGGALATLFAADVAEYAMDAGRACPQLEPSQPWWITLQSNFLKANTKTIKKGPPSPKSLRVYTFGSPRVGNKPFVRNFENLVENGSIQEAYRVVNNADIVARLPRSVNALVLGTVEYDHCGATALIEIPKAKEAVNKKDKKQGLTKNDLFNEDTPLLWIEGESDDNVCPVRDGATPLTSPLAKGALLGDLFDVVKNYTSVSDETLSSTKSNDSSSKTLSLASNYVSQLSSITKDLTASVSNRLQSVSVSDFTSIVGIDKDYTNREIKMVESVFSGDALAHHMEDEYYQAMGRACGYIALVGKEIQSIESIKQKLENGRADDAIDLVLTNMREEDQDEEEGKFMGQDTSKSEKVDDMLKILQ